MANDCVKYEILPLTSLSTSPHAALILQVQDVHNTPLTAKVLVKRSKIQWKKDSVDQYQNLLQEYLEDMDDNIEEVTEAIKYLITAIQNATSMAFPITQIKPRSKPKTWNNTIKKLVLASKNVDYNWKQAGCPGPPDALFTERKHIRHQVRSAQRIQVAINREKNQHKIMMAHADDQDTFHKVIRRQRNQPSQQVNELVYNNVHHTENLLPDGQATLAH